MTTTTKEKEVIQQIPSNITSEQVIQVISRGKVKSNHLNALKTYIDLSDEILSNSFNINVKTFRHYKNKSSSLNPQLQEHFIMLLALAKHGKEVFGSSKEFSKWLVTKNFTLGKEPIEFINTISGIKFIDDRLTGMEYGDNA